MSDALALAERALAATGDAEALAHVTAERSLLLRFARSRPTQATSIDDVTVELCVLRKGHVGRAATNETDDASLRACAAAADEAAAALGARGSGEYPVFPPPGSARAHTGYDAQVGRLDPRTGGSALSAAFEACARSGAEAHGVWSAADVDVAVCSSTGVAATERLSDAFMKVTAIAPDGRSGYAAATGVDLDALDAGALARRAADKATAPGSRTALVPGEYTVVLEPHAVGELLTWLGATAFNGLAHAEGRGALSERIGERVTAAQVNVADSPRHPRTLPRALDAEGVVKAPLPLIEDGVARNVVHDTRSAALVGARSTGHALAPGGAPAGPMPTNLVLGGGGAADEAELCTPVERGVYVTRLWYTNPLRPKETLITGVTRDGTFLIEDGRISRPIDDLRLTDSVLELFRRVEQVGARSALTSDGEFYGRRFATGVVCPPIRTRMRFTA